MNVLPALLEEHDNFNEAEHLVHVEGLSSPKVCNLLNRLVSTLKPGETYLEIGTWKGLTLCSAAFENQGKHIVACDKFRFYGSFTGLGVLAKRELQRNIERYKNKSAAITFHHMTSRQLFERGLVPKGVKVYFYDGDHTYEGTKHGIVQCVPMLCHESYLLVDDWNDPEIQRATRDALKETKISVKWEKVLEGENGSQQGWWNGLGIFYLSRS